MPTNLTENNTTFPSPVVVPNPGEPRTAASVRTPFQTVTDRSAYLKRVFEELIGGVTEAAHLKAHHITFTGNLYSSGPSSQVSFSTAQIAALQVTNGLNVDYTFAQLTGSPLTLDSGSPAQFDGPATFNALVTATANINANRVETADLLAGGTAFIVSTTLIQLGVPAYLNQPLFCQSAGRVVEKVIVGATTNHVYSVGDATLVMVPTLPSAVTYQVLDAPNEGDTMTFSMMADTTADSFNGVLLARQTGVQIGAHALQKNAAVTDPNIPTWMRIVWIGGAWQPAMSGR